ncbi:MAG: AMP-binding protein [Acidobacteriota bacterium]
MDTEKLGSPQDSKQQDELWKEYVRRLPLGPEPPFEEQWSSFERIYANRRMEDGPPLIWQPAQEQVVTSNLGRSMSGLGFGDYASFYQWSITERAQFWESVIKRLGIVLRTEPVEMIDLQRGAEHPHWLPGSEMNCVDSCLLAASDKPAVISMREGSAEIDVTTYGELESLANRVANGLIEQGMKAGDGIVLYMPMTVQCVAAYLGIVRAGCRVVSIADSFAAAELRRRLDIGSAKMILTVEKFVRAGKTIDLYSKVKEANAAGAIVIPTEGNHSIAPRKGDLLWEDFLSPDGNFEPVVVDPYQVINVLFSSGTTGTPKAIGWTHLTPIKCAMDGHFHQDIHESDVVAWPTNVGWMMGPWLIFATLINRATMALYEGAPTGKGFARFVREAKVSVLGVVPSLVRVWRSTHALEGVDWGSVRLFSSTGEPSNRKDYLWLMSRAHYRAPVIEYCGGTEIGGAYVTGTVVQPASPATFTSPALGMDLVILDQRGDPVGEGETGEVYLIPPSIGLSQELMNRDHHKEYYAGCPLGPHGEILRRHGDEMTRLHGGWYKAQGRADDTMNLGGVKVSSLELERVMDAHEAVFESAAVAVQPGGEGADKLVVYVVPREGADRTQLVKELGSRIAREINPLFKIHDLVVTTELPRTPSNKLMRRQLRHLHAEGDFE